MKSFRELSEILASLVLIGILLLFIKPTQLLMPKSLEQMIVVFLIVSFLTFAALIWNERTTDERDELHRMSAGRLSFILGATLLVIGISWQSLHKSVDPWLVYTLTIMVLAKIGSRMYNRLRH